MASYLAIDLGAESGRAMLGSVERGRLDLREVHRFPNGPLQVGETLRWDFDAIWRGVETGLAAVPDGELTSIGVDAWGCDYGLVDEDGVLIEPPFHYRDRRTEGVMTRVFDRVGRDRIYETTGVQCLPINTLYQLIAATERSPAVLDRADRILTIPDLINHRLTGRMANEFTNATTTQCIDARSRGWAMDLIGDLGLPARLFGPIVEPGTAIGVLSAVVQERLAGTPVVAPACHDTGSAVASVRAGGDTAFISSGTWSLLGTEVDAPVITTRSRDLNFTNEGGVAGTTRLLKNISGLWLLQSCRRQWAAEGRPWTYDELVAGAADERCACGSIVDPDDPSFLSPANMVRAIRDYCDRTGQSVPDRPAGYARLIFESLALKYRLVLEALEDITGSSFSIIRIVGGGSRNALLNQFTADATGRTVLAGPVEATTLGNIAVQLVSRGGAASIGEAREIIDRSFPADRYEPRQSARWEGPYQRLRELCALGTSDRT